MRPNDLTCQELVETVTAYLEGMLGAAERAIFEAHLAVCEGCRTYLDQIRRTIAAVRTLRLHEVQCLRPLHRLHPVGGS